MRAMAANEIQTLKQKPGIRITAEPEMFIAEGGLQPFLFRMRRSGTLVMQVQLPEAPYPAARMTFHSKMQTLVSRDNGTSWNEYVRKPGVNEVNLEGGALQSENGAIIALDTYVVPSGTKGIGLGQRYESQDDWQSLGEPLGVLFDLPGARFDAGTDDGGEAHRALRLHRRIVELPAGALLTTLYGWFDGDTEPASYMKTMPKMRVVLVRSDDQGNSWRLVSDVAAFPKPGTEGFCEAVLLRLKSGVKAGALQCMMRTGRELYEAWSYDDGQTWSNAVAVDFGVRSIWDTQEWADMFEDVPEHHGQPTDGRKVELAGAYVDPDLIELQSGVLACAFGIRIPEKMCWKRPEHPWNGNYVAFSFDQGRTWEHVIQMTSGVLTTHYMGIEEIASGELLVVYDFGDWENKRGRYAYGRKITLHGLE